jgi:hypothetical protein
MFFESSVSGGKCILKTNDISKPEQYQAIIIAVDMMNEELEKTGTSDLLRNNGYPYRFEIEELSSTYRIVRDFIIRRNKISKFNNGRLILREISEQEIVKTYDDFKKIINFSPGETEQLKRISNYVYSKATSKSIDDIGERLRRLFGYSIDHMIVTRQFRLDGSHKTFLEYIGIRKPKELCISITYTLKEESKKAKFKDDVCTITEKLDDDRKGFVNCDEGNKCRFTWPDTDGYDYIDKLVGACQVEDCWAVNQDFLNSYYPDNPEPFEDIRLDMVYPICKVLLKLEFPLGYQVQPRCIYDLGGTEHYLELQYEKEKNIFFIENLHQDDISARIYPKYRIIWDVPNLP